MRSCLTSHRQLENAALMGAMVVWVQCKAIPIRNMGAGKKQPGIQPIPLRLVGKVLFPEARCAQKYNESNALPSGASNPTD